MNFNGKVTIQKKKIPSKYRRQTLGYRVQRQSSLLIKFVLTHIYFSVSYLILTLDEKGRQL